MALRCFALFLSLENQQPSSERSRGRRGRFMACESWEVPAPTACSRRADGQDCAREKHGTVEASGNFHPWQSIMNRTALAIAVLGVLTANSTSAQGKYEAVVTGMWTEDITKSFDITNTSGPFVDSCLNPIGLVEGTLTTSAAATGIDASVSADGFDRANNCSLSREVSAAGLLYRYYWWCGAEEEPMGGYEIAACVEVDAAVNINAARAGAYAGGSGAVSWGISPQAQASSGTIVGNVAATLEVAAEAVAGDLAPLTGFTSTPSVGLGSYDPDPVEDCLTQDGTGSCIATFAVASATSVSGGASVNGRNQITASADGAAEVANTVCLFLFDDASCERE